MLILRVITIAITSVLIDGSSLVDISTAALRQVRGPVSLFHSKPDHLSATNIIISGECGGSSWCRDISRGGHDLNRDTGDDG